jgi:hypothetical protein
MQSVKGHSTEIDNLEELEDKDDLLEDGTDCGIFDSNIISNVTWKLKLEEMSYFKSQIIGNYFYDAKLDSGEEDMGTEEAKAFEIFFLKLNSDKQQSTDKSSTPLAWATTTTNNNKKHKLTRGFSINCKYSLLTLHICQTDCDRSSVFNEGRYW